MAHCYWFSFGVAFLLSAGLPVSSLPQGMDPSQFGNIRVHVVYPDDRAAGMLLRVRLMGGSGSLPESEAFTDGQGRAEFVRVPIGTYHVVVTGDGIKDADSGEFEVDRRKVSQDLFITVHWVESNSKQGETRQASVAAVDLNVPDDARKEFDEASKAMASEKWDKAIQRLKRAVAIYPQYAPAYNNLGVAYGRLNDSAREHEALEKAISVNDHFVPAFVNLGKLCLREHDSVRAETLLGDALRVDPANAETMTLLAEAQLLNQHFDAAIASAHKVHSIPHPNMAVVHYIAARAFEHEDRFEDALAELQVFLTEEPSGARADHVREEIAKIQHANR